MNNNMFKVLGLTFWLMILSTTVLADGIPQPMQLGMQPPATPVMEKLNALHNNLLYVITAIVVFVTALMVYIMIRFNAKANPIPSTTTHNLKLEVIWTAIPVIILVAIAWPSLKILYYMDKPQDADMTVKVVGYQWYWSYEYPDNEGIKFESRMIDSAEIKQGQPRLLEVDNPLVVPIGSTVRVLTTGADVIHNWYVPALGVNEATNPGRTNETWFKINKPGTYYGQCAQLCGINHGFMPIKVVAVEKDEFEAWVISAKKKFAANATESTNILQAAN